MAVEDTLIDRFFDEECNDYVRDALLNKVKTRSTGSRYFTFNVFNIRLDFESSRVTVEDELEPEMTTTTSLQDFVERVRRS